ncbi:MBL fold metallo-hydrolase [Caldimonas tepidiphila]|uniref:MBL fold metallo-hydrolase n=1 Tax=Caldimonas tepidiphila TaxID=2315841 RepID=UPI000E5B57CE|nr:MBL fold metallo-hydrolase [Caldimonas tepidiphila]
MLDFLESAGHGITVIDTGFHRPRFDAAYLIVENGRAAYVDTGTNHAVPRLLAALEAQGLGPDAVDWLIVTHVHLDHAGGAGRLMQHLPNARLVVHPRGARHMVDPAALMDGARAVYGEAVFERDYGTIEPVAAQRIVSPADGDTLELAGRPLRFIDTPGHARHHHCIWDEASRGWFTGDTFGIGYQELLSAQGRHIIPSSTPVQFEPDAMRRSIERLLQADPQRVYLTHFGATGDVQRLAALTLRQVDAMVRVALEAPFDGSRDHELQDRLEALYLEEWRRCGPVGDEASVRDLLALDIELNAQGLAVWRQRQRESAARAVS